MGRPLTITNSHDASLGVRKKAIKREIVIGPTAIKFITLAIFAVLALVYLTQATEGANRSLKVREVNETKAELELKRERLEVEKVRLQSLQQIDQNIQKPVDQNAPQATLEPISSVEHLQHDSYGLASR